MVGQESGAHPPVPVLPREAAAVFFDEGGDVARDPVKVLSPPGRLEIKDWAEVDFPGSGVGVVDGVLAVKFHQFPDVVHVIGQVGEGDGGVFDAGDGLGVPDDVAQDAEAGGAEVPGGFHGGGAPEVAVGEDVGADVGALAQARFGRAGEVGGLGVGGGAELDEEEGAGVSRDEGGVFRLVRVLAGQP